MRRRQATLVTADPEDGVAPKCGRIGVALTVLGGLLHLGSIVLRGVAAGRVPWANMYEYMLAVGLVAITGWLYLLWKHRVRRVSVFVLLPIALLLFIAGNQLYTEALPLQPSLRSYWIAIHVAAAIMASGVFLLSGVVSGLHLMSNKDGDGVTSTRKPIGDRLPPADYLDRVAYRTSRVRQAHEPDRGLGRRVATTDPQVGGSHVLEIRSAGCVRRADRSTALSTIRATACAPTKLVGNIKPAMPLALPNRGATPALRSSHHAHHANGTTITGLVAAPGV
ncbi:MAG: cytochrome c biogenesis protein CcsA [Umezawaea sp.]